MKKIHLNEPFILVVEFGSNALLGITNFQNWLHFESFTYQVETNQNVITFNISVDDFTDAAKVETFIATINQ